MKFLGSPRCAKTQRGDFCLTALQKATYAPDARFSLENALRQELTGAAFGATVSSLDNLVSSAKKDAFLAGFYEKEIKDAQNVNTAVNESETSAVEKETSVEVSVPNPIESSVSAVYNQDAAKVRERILSTEIPKILNRGHQNKHIKDSKGYIPGRSYIYGDIDTAQKLIDQYHGSGKLVFSDSGVWQHKELIQSNDVIGVAIDPLTGEETETRCFTIHYGKNGTHIVPRKEQKR